MIRTPKQPDISVIIPTLNGEGTLEQFFVALKRQHLQASEVLVVDSSSTDRSVEIAQDYGAEVLSIARSEYDHGGTRTRMARQAKGEILVFFTQDAIPASRNALQLLVAPLQDRTVACSYGRQLPNVNASPVAAHLRLFNYPPESSQREYGDRSRYGLKTIFISNSFAAYRKDRLEEVGCFKNGLIFGEDTCTLGRILAAGHKVVYVGKAAVYHSHNYSMGAELRRSFDIGVLHSREKWLLDTYGQAEGVGAQYVRSAVLALLGGKHYLLIPDCLLRSAVKLIGYKLGRSYKILPTTWLPALSMNRLWWERYK
jgi:rhamnosyltransferase